MFQVKTSKTPPVQHSSHPVNLLTKVHPVNLLTKVHPVNLLTKVHPVNECGLLLNHSTNSQHGDNDAVKGIWTKCHHSQRESPQSQFYEVCRYAALQYLHVTKPSDDTVT